MSNGFDFYSPLNLKSYNLNESMRYQLNVLDQLDAFTRKHSENVANISCRLCEHLHYSNQFIIHCTMCAYLHDIGKVFVPPEILQKNDKLTEEEFEKVKMHTIYGYDMCRKDPLLAPYANGARYHHENLDGSGYPDGLRGSKIPLEAKIIKVADVYDALVSKRQYKSHMDISETLKYVAEESRTKKSHKKIVAALKKVVIEDINYEIYELSSYLDILKYNVKRLTEVDLLYKQSTNPSLLKNKEYYLKKIYSALEENETLINYPLILKEYKNTLETKTTTIKKLFKEIKKVKKLRI